MLSTNMKIDFQARLAASGTATNFRDKHCAGLFEVLRGGQGGFKDGSRDEPGAGDDVHSYHGLHVPIFLIYRILEDPGADGLQFGRCDALFC